MLYVHRWASLLAGVFILYIAVTGLWMQSMDLYAQVSHQDASDPTIQEFRQHLNGPDNFAVMSDPDFTGATLPAGFDTDKALALVAAAAHKAVPDQPLRMIELRMVHGHVAGRARMGKTFLLFDAQSGERLPDAWRPPANPNQINPGLRNEVKNWHKFTFNKFMLQKGSIFNLLAAIALLVLAYTGIAQFLRLLKMRRKIGKTELFWSAGGAWRKFHRWTAIVMGVVVVYLTITGSLLAISDLGAAWAEWKSPRASRPIHPDFGDFSSPIKDAEIAGMAKATQAAFDAAHPGTAIRVLQLRYYAHYAQGAVVTGENGPVQHVYNTRTGQEMSETEPGYPIPNFPFGWQWHQTVKKFHRGDIIGLGGNWLEWLGGVALLYFAVSGLWMYYQMWSRRAKAGRRQAVWK